MSHPDRLGRLIRRPVHFGQAHQVNTNILLIASVSGHRRERGPLAFEARSRYSRISRCRPWRFSTSAML